MFLTPLINAGNITQARKASLVGAPMSSFAESYSGYLTVNKPICDSNLFFWFFPAKVKNRYFYNFYGARKSSSLK